MLLSISIAHQLKMKTISPAWSTEGSACSPVAFQWSQNEDPGYLDIWLCRELLDYFVNEAKMPKRQQKLFGVPPSACLPIDESTQPPSHRATQGGAKLQVKQVQPPGNSTHLCIIYLCATAIRKKKKKKGKKVIPMLSLGRNDMEMTSLTSLSKVYVSVWSSKAIS